MNVMLLAPQPFYQERGTPIAVDMVLKVLSERGEQVDVLTYHEGADLRYDGVSIHRTFNVPFIKGIRPGFSWKKLICDGLMLIQAIHMASRRQYQLIHAVEESVFIALVLKWMFKFPYIYDMDSSLRQQMIEKSYLFSPFAFPLKLLEKLAVRNAAAVVPVCDALAEYIVQHQPKWVVILRDVSLLQEEEHPNPVNLRAELGITGALLMYVGNLEAYQGIDLLLESFALALTKESWVDLVIIGGKLADIEKYQQKCWRLGIDENVHFLGPKPLADLANYLAEADILISPRVKGQNTPMKLYSYLHSGKAVLATNLSTHTQVLNGDLALLADPAPEAFSRGMLHLINHATLRSNLGTAGKKLIEGRYSFSAFHEKLNSLYTWLSASSVETTKL